MFLGALATSILGNALAGWGVVRAGEGKIRAGESFNAASFLTNFEIRKYYQNEPKFNSVIQELIYLK